MKNRYPVAFSPLKIKNTTIPNRIVFPAFSFNFANNDGTVSDKLIKLYDDISVAGPGLIITGGAACTPKSIGFTHDFRIYNDSFIPGISRMLAGITKNGAIPGVQLLAFGRQGLDPTKPTIAPSALPCLETKRLCEELGIEYKVKAMTVEEIEIVKQDYIAAGRRAFQAGAHIIELNAAHGYFLNQFLSPYSNKRDDGYGGSPVHRTRIIREILEGIKKNVHPDTILSVRVSGNEFVAGGLVPRDFEEIIPLFEKAGMDLLNVSVCIGESLQALYPYIYSKGKAHKPGEAHYVDIAAELKGYARVPVCYCGFVSSVASAEEILSLGKADLVALARAQFADNRLVHKSKMGKEADIRKCVYDDQCLFFMTGDRQAYCTVNPEYKKIRGR